MNDLEIEFAKLIQSFYKIIRDKEDAGEYTTQQADDLSEMLNERTSPPSRAKAWNPSASWCPELDDDNW